MVIGYLSCAFDLLNVGDLDLIAQARTHCDHLVIGVQTDEEVWRRTGRAPVVPLTERMELVRHVRGVDAVLTHDHRAEIIGRSHVVFAIGDGFGDDRTDRWAEDDHLRRHSEQLCWIAPRRETASSEVLAALAPAAGAA